MDAAPEGDVGLGVGTVQPELGGGVEVTGVAVCRAVEQHHGGAGGDVDAADRGGASRQPEVRLHRTLDPQRLIDEVGDALRVGPELVLELRVFGQVFESDGKEACRRLLAGREEERCRPYDRGDVRNGAVGVGALRQPGQHVVTRLAATVLDIRGERLVEPAEGVDPHVALRISDCSRRRAHTESLGRNR